MKASVTRVVEIGDLTAVELATLFCGLNDFEQVEFLEEIHRIAATWPGAGWCQQSYSIAHVAGPKACEVIATLAEHMAEANRPS